MKKIRLLFQRKILPFLVALPLLCNVGNALGSYAAPFNTKFTEHDDGTYTIKGIAMRTVAEDIYTKRNVIDTSNNTPNKIIAKDIKILSKYAYVKVTNHGTVSFGANLVNLNKYNAYLCGIGIKFFLEHEGQPIIIDVNTAGKNRSKKSSLGVLKPKQKTRFHGCNLPFCSFKEQDAMIDAVNNKQEINYEIYLALKKDTVTTFDAIYQANKVLFWIIISSVVVTLLGISTWIGWWIKKQHDKKKNPSTEEENKEDQNQATPKIAPQSKPIKEKLQSKK